MRDPYIRVAHPVMLLRLPPDPPEKWRTVRSALETTAKTRRLCVILLVSSIPFSLLLATAIVLAIVKR
jgi:hypothetical protein